MHTRLKYLLNNKVQTKFSIETLIDVLVDTSNDTQDHSSILMVFQGHSTDTQTSRPVSVIECL